MKNVYLDATVAVNQQALRSLGRAISLPRQRFSLVLVQCEHDAMREQALQDLPEQSLINGINGKCLYLPESTQSIYTEIQKLCQFGQPSSLMIFGLESVLNLDEVLISFNRMRNEFKSKFHFPIVLWVNDQVIKRFVKLAPDLYNWAGIPIRLELARNENGFQNS